MLYRQKASELSQKKEQIALGIQQNVLGNKPNIKVWKSLDFGSEYK